MSNQQKIFKTSYIWNSTMKCTCNHMKILKHQISCETLQTSKEDFSLDMLRITKTTSTCYHKLPKFTQINT